MNMAADVELSGVMRGERYTVVGTQAATHELPATASYSRSLGGNFEGQMLRGVAIPGLHLLAPVGCPNHLLVLHGFAFKELLRGWESNLPSALKGARSMMNGEIH